MVIEIKQQDTPENIKKKLETLARQADEDKKARLSKLFGSLKLKEDAVTMQRRWRDEW
jgi:hypothetical protein